MPTPHTPTPTPLSILLSPTPPSHLKSQLERDLTTIRKRIRRAKSHSIPPTTIISIIDKIKQLADIYANTAMAYVTAGSTAEVYAISAGALERLMRVEAELRRVDGEEGGEYEGRERRREEVWRESKNYKKQEGRESRKRREESELKNTQKYSELHGETSSSDKGKGKQPFRQPSPNPQNQNQNPNIKKQPDCENPYAETVGGRFELMGVPDLTGRRKERYDVFQHGNKSLGNLEVKNVAAARKPAVPIHHNHVPEKEVVVKDPYARVRATPANERLVKMKRK